MWPQMGQSSVGTEAMEEGHVASLQPFTWAFAVRIVHLLFGGMELRLGPPIPVPEPAHTALSVEEQTSFLPCRISELMGRTTRLRVC